MHDSIETAFMDLLASTTLQYPTLLDDSFSSFKSAISLSTGLRDLIHSCCATPFSGSNQVRLASLLTRLRGALEDIDVRVESGAYRRSSVRFLVTDDMVPTISEVCHNEAAFDLLEKDLQVRVFDERRLHAC